MLHVSDVPQLRADILGCSDNIKRTELLVVKLLDFFSFSNNVIKCVRLVPLTLVNVGLVCVIFFFFLIVKCDSCGGITHSF